MTNVPHVTMTTGEKNVVTYKFDLKTGVKTISRPFSVRKPVIIRLNWGKLSNETVRKKVKRYYSVVKLDKLKN